MQMTDQYIKLIYIETTGFDLDASDADLLGFARALLSASKPAAPMGWQVVPVEPTEEMMNAGLYQSSHDSTSADVHSIWKDMCAFAPAAPAQSKTDAGALYEAWQTTFDHIDAPPQPHLTSSAAESNDRQIDAAGQQESVRFDMLAHLQRQREWSERTFGPGARTKGVVDHIRKELREIESDPTDITEWIDVVILALDGVWRAGASPQQIIETMVAKQTKNEGRVWPDWRTADPDKAIEHDRSHDTNTLPTQPAEGGETDQFGIDDCIEALVDAKTLAEKLIARNQLDLAISRKIEAAQPSPGAKP